MNSKHHFLGILLLFLFYKTTIGTVVYPCKDARSTKGHSGFGKIEDVRVSNCPNHPPCQLKKGTDVHVEFDFRPDKKYETLTNSVYGGLGGSDIIKVPFRGVNGVDACKNIRRKSDGRKGCPLDPEHVYTYSNSFPILKVYPNVALTVQYGINHGQSSVVCFTVPAKVVN